MRSFLLLTVLLAACGGSDSDPHDVIDCDKAAWGANRKCERACAARPSGGMDSGGGSDKTCWGERPGSLDPNTGMPFRTPCLTDHVTAYEGERGCCVIQPVGSSEPIPFVPCEAE